MGTAAAGIDGPVQQVPHGVPSLLAVKRKRKSVNDTSGHARNLPRAPRGQDSIGIVEQFVVAVAKTGPKRCGASGDEHHHHVASSIEHSAQQRNLLRCKQKL